MGKHFNSRVAPRAVVFASFPFRYNLTRPIARSAAPYPRSARERRGPVGYLHPPPDQLAWKSMFKGLGNLGNIASMVGAMKDLPEKMQELNQRMQDEHVTGASSCGRVTVIVNCVGEVQSVNLVEEITERVEIEQATLEATNRAGASAKQTYADAIREMVADMNLDFPGIDGLLTPFTGR